MNSRPIQWTDHSLAPPPNRPEVDRVQGLVNAAMEYAILINGPGVRADKLAAALNRLDAARAALRSPEGQQDAFAELVATWRREARVAEREWEASGHPSAAGRYTQLDACADALEAALALGPCVNCDGTGHDPIDEDKLCRVCGGTGEPE